MPAVHAVPVHIEEADILRRQEFPGSSRLHPKIAAEIRELTELAYELIAPAAVYEIYPVAGMGSDHFHLRNGARLNGKCLVSILSAAREVAVAVCTIGIALEMIVDEYLSENKIFKGVLLDSIGSTPVDGDALEAYRLIRKEAQDRGLKISSPVSPGLHGWDLAGQGLCFLWRLPIASPSISIGQR